METKLIKQAVGCEVVAMLKPMQVAGLVSCVILVVTIGTAAVHAESPGQEGKESAQSPTEPKAPTEPKRVRTTIIRPDEAERRRMESAWSTEPNSLTWSEYMGAMAISTDRAAQKPVESVQSPIAPNALTEPKHVRTTIIRTDQAEQKHYEPPQLPTVPR